MISTNTIILILCVLLILIALVQGKLKKPKRIVKIEKEEKDKRERYSHIIKEALYIEGCKDNVQEVSGSIGVRDEFVTFFNDVKTKYEDWEVETRNEEILIPINEIQYIAYENGKEIRDIISEKLDEQSIYLILGQTDGRMIFKISSEVNEDFIEYIRNKKTA